MTDDTYTTPQHVELPPAPSTNGGSPTEPEHTTPKDSKGWDGKLRVEKKAVITNPEALSDPEYSDEDAPPVERINADEGGLKGSKLRLKDWS
jgi:hypothetical protein